MKTLLSDHPLTSSSRAIISNVLEHRCNTHVRKRVLSLSYASTQFSLNSKEYNMKYLAIKESVSQLRLGKTFAVLWAGTTSKPQHRHNYPLFCALRICKICKRTEKNLLCYQSLGGSNVLKQRYTPPWLSSTNIKYVLLIFLYTYSVRY